MRVITSLSSLVPCRTMLSNYIKNYKHVYTQTQTQNTEVAC